MLKLSTTAIVLATFGLSASAMAVLPTVALDPNTAQAPSASISSANPSTGVPSSASNPAATGQIQSRILVSLVSRDAQGQETLSPVTSQTQLTQGNIVEYRGYLTNNSPERIRNMKVTMDIPANMELVGTEDMSPDRPYGSTDGTNFQYMPLKTNVNGVLQNLPMSYYKAVQWDIPGLGLNEVATVKYRLRVK